jgi:hypothetical protein
MLASQPTLSRFENALGPKALMRMGCALADTVVERHRRRLRGRVKRITVELDPTDDPTHGAQQLTFFNGHYDTWCYLPVAGFVQFDEEPEQYLFAYLLRPGNASAKLGAIGLLRRIVTRLREAFPKARIRVRLDGGFAGAEMFDFLEHERLEYVIAMAENSVLKTHAQPLMGWARQLSELSGATEHLYGECRYAAQTWSRKRRVVIKAEVVRLGDQGSTREAPRAQGRRSAHCACGFSSSACGSIDRCAASSCICPTRPRGARTGAVLRARSVPCRAESRSATLRLTARSIGWR